MMRCVEKSEFSFNSQDWFDSEIAEAIKLREKYFKKFKKSNLHIDSDFYIEAKYNVQKLTKQNKIAFYNAKLTENILAESKSIFN